MGNFSREKTFDALKRYVSVRLQQGVPLVDADWNEQDDIRRFELQAFLKWFVGNGVPQGNNGFQILPLPSGLTSEQRNNNFLIKGGDGTVEGAGRCLVEGWDVINTGDLIYSTQKEINGESIEPLTTPNEDRKDLVYLDVWEREVDSSEDMDLVNPNIGLETCVRIKREWIVRVEEDFQGTAERPSTQLPGHVYYALARLERKVNESSIQAAHIKDLRHVGLSMVSNQVLQDIDHKLQRIGNNEAQIGHDLYGTSANLDGQGSPDLEISLRDTINALLQGNLPTTPVKPLTEVGRRLRHTNPIALLEHNHILVFWIAENDEHSGIEYNSSRSERTERLFTPDNRRVVRLFCLKHDQLPPLLCYVSEEEQNHKIYFGPFDGRGQIDERLVTDNASSDSDLFALVMEDDNNQPTEIWVFWTFNNEIHSKFLPLSGGSEFRDGPEPIKDENLNNMFPLKLGQEIWIFWTSSLSESNRIHARQKLSNTWQNPRELRLPGDDQNITDMFILLDMQKSLAGEGGILIFGVFQSRKIWFSMTGLNPRDTTLNPVKLTECDPYHMILNLSALQDQNGDIWVFWTEWAIVGSFQDIWCQRYESRHRRWSNRTQLGESFKQEHVFPPLSVLMDANNYINLFWPLWRPPSSPCAAIASQKIITRL
jgi:hypothetical protein